MKIQYVGYFVIKGLLSVVFLSAALSAGAAEPAPVYLYGVEFTRPGTELKIASETYEAIRRGVAPRPLVVRNVSLFEFDRLMAENKADIVITNSGIYRRHILNGWKDVVTLATLLQPDPDHAVGSLLLARKGLGIKTFEDLRGHSIVLNTPSAFQGTLTIKKELIDRGYAPEKFFGGVRYIGTFPEKRLDAVRRGEADSTFLSVCYLERLKQRTGEDLTREFDLVGARREHGNLCLSSTALYPNYTILISPNLSSRVVREVATELLKLSPDADGEYWTIASDYRAVDDMYRAVKAGPYAYLNSWTAKRIWDEFGTLILLLLMTLAFAVWHVWRTGLAVQKATEEIEKATEEQKKNLVKTESIKSALAVSSLSSIVAHELGQPLAACLFYAKSIQKILKKPEPPLAMLQNAADGLTAQIERVNGIVKIVQQIAKNRASAVESVAADSAVREILEKFVKDHALAPGTVETGLGAEGVLIGMPRLEFEIVVGNLVKNSFEALKAKEHPKITVRTRAAENKYELVVTDNSGTLSLDKFRNLEVPFTSAKDEGLGLGLTIVKAVLARHCGSLNLARTEEGSLVCTVTIPSKENKGGTNESGL
jgi:two-component system sensor histidine kinase TtrS